MKYIPGKRNAKADALSRNGNASPEPPVDWMDDEIYSIVIDDSTFMHQVSKEQDEDDNILAAKENVTKSLPVKGQFKRVRNQLRIEKEILTKSGRPIIPRSMRSFVFEQYRKSCHFEINKMYDILKKRFYCTNMYKSLSNMLSTCSICAQCKIDTHHLRAPLVPIYEATSPMEFTSLDIGYMPTDVDGYRYILLIGDLFSKYLEVLPLRNL